MNSDRSLTLFIPCIIDGMYPEVAEAAVHVLRRLGLRVVYAPDQTCCGQPAFNSGYRKEAAAAAKHFIEVFEGEGAIVCPSGSCVNMVRHHYAELFRNDPVWLEKSLSVRTRTFEFTEYLVDILGVEDTGASYSGRVTYHDSCHLSRGIGVREQPRKLIRGVRGIDFVEMEESDRCCGFGGSFSFKYSEISSAILEGKIGNIIDSGAQTVVGCDMGCLMNIQGMLSRKNSPIRTMHIAELLAKTGMVYGSR